MNESRLTVKSLDGEVLCGPLGTLSFELTMLLAGDVGGTKTLLGLFDESDSRRPRELLRRSYVTLEFESLSGIVSRFFDDVRSEVPGADPASACFGVAGPVIQGRAVLTNVPWEVSAAEVSERLRIARVGLLNDLESMAYGVPVLGPDELLPLQGGTRDANGNAGLIAAGTGLGQSLLHRWEGRIVPVPSEGGHADFSGRTEAELELTRALTKWYGRAEVEHVLCGRGLINLHRFVHEIWQPGDCAAVPENADPRMAPALISTAGLEQRCERCVTVLDMFVSAYGAEAGNLALRGVTTGGMFVGGGIAPKILPAFEDGRFVRAFGAKPPMDDWLTRIPVQVILNQTTGLLGAAVYAARQL